MPLRVYYAHAMCIYGTSTESNEISAIAKWLPHYEIVNPSLFQTKVDGIDAGMFPFYGIIDICHVLVFSRLLGKITSGVGLEVNYALKKSVPVYELRSSGITKIYAYIKFLSREETIRHYSLWRIANPSPPAI